MTQSAENCRTLLISIEGMHCQNCAGKVRAALTGVAGVSAAEVALEQKQARVTFDPALTGAPVLVQAVKTAGFAVSGFARG